MYIFFAEVSNSGRNVFVAYPIAVRRKRNFLIVS